MKLLLELFGADAAESITPQSIERKLMAAEKERKWMPAAVNRYKALLSLVFRIAVENGKVDSNPVRLVRRRREDNAKVRFLTFDEELKLRSIIEPKHPERWAAIAFAINTGVRAGEQYALEWSDVERTGDGASQVRIAKSKNGASRYIPLNPVALEALATAKKYLPEDDRVFSQQPYRM